MSPMPNGRGHGAHHEALCNAEQAHMLRAIAGDLDLARHMEDAVKSLRIAPCRR